MEMKIVLLFIMADVYFIIVFINLISFVIFLIQLRTSHG